MVSFSSNLEQKILYSTLNESTQNRQFIPRIVHPILYKPLHEVIKLEQKIKNTGGNSSSFHVRLPTQNIKDILDYLDLGN